MLRHMWSHRSSVHRRAVKLYNRAAEHIPNRFKYNAATLARRKRLMPYSLITPTSITVQVGAPSDTLQSGRSRGFTFASLTAGGGTTIIVEPDAASAKMFESLATERSFDHVSVHAVAATSESGELELMIDPEHRATNFIEGRVDYEAEERQRFESVVVPARRLDEILDQEGIDHIDVLSVTTNGAETEILQGAGDWLAKTRYVALAATGDATGEDLPALLSEYGFAFESFDDRGFTYRNPALVL